MNTAQIILSQLQLNKPVLCSWGAHAFKSVNSQQFKDSFGNHMGSLIFKSNGRLRKGHVAISLMPNDTYTVHYGSLRKGEFKVLKSVSDVYVDMLHSIIDSEIEYNPK